MKSRTTYGRQHLICGIFSRVILLPIAIGLFAVAVTQFGYCQTIKSPIPTLYSQPQNQISPSAACPLEGPSIADTLKYINDALAAWGRPVQNRPSDGERYSLAVSQEDELALTEYNPETKKSYKHTYSIMSLNCKARGRGYPDDYVISAQCLDERSCGKSSLLRDGGDWTEPRSWLSDTALEIALITDNEHGDRLTRALSHLIALLQQQYKQSHSDPNDPFAKP